MVSDVSAERLVSADNLIPCRYCKSKTISGCSCNKKHRQCNIRDKYDFQRLYCDLLALDSPGMTAKKIYVTSKYYDDIGEVLSSIGLEYSPVTGKFDCDILSINCGTNDAIDAKELAAFVCKGGCSYASDLASK